jgi:cytochrome c553
MRYFLAIFAFTIVAVVSVAGFRGAKFTHDPYFIFPDMEWQAKPRPQGENSFPGFNDHRDDRPVPVGAVQRGYGWAMGEVFSSDFNYAPSQNPSLYSGRDRNGDFYKGFPVHVTADFIELGHQKFNINCAVCHGITGNGNGAVKKYMSTIRDLTDAYTSAKTEGEIFTTITYGHGKMGPYGDRITPVERWAIVSYVRSLQLAGNATPDNVPPAERAKLGL